MCVCVRARAREMESQSDKQPHFKADILRVASVRLSERARLKCGKSMTITLPTLLKACK